MVWEAESWEWKISGGLGTLEMQRKGLRGGLWGFKGFIWDLGNEEEEIEDRLEYISVLFESYQCFRFFLLKKSKIKESKKRKLTL